MGLWGGEVSAQETSSTASLRRKAREWPQRTRPHTRRIGPHTGRIGGPSGASGGGRGAIVGVRAPAASAAAARRRRGARGVGGNRASAGRGGRPAGTDWDVQAAAIEAAAASTADAGAVGSEERKVFA